MNETKPLYRLFINFCISVALGLLVLLLEYTVLGVGETDTKILWYMVASGAAISVTLELVFSDFIPLSGNQVRHRILWRNRLIAAVVNAVIIAVLGKLMLGYASSFILLLALSVGLCVAAVVVAGILSDIRYKHSVKEMNRRLKQLSELTGDTDTPSEDGGDGE